MNLSQASKMTEEQAREYIESILWPDGIPVCPHCGNRGAWKMRGKSVRAGLWKCSNKKCRKPFTVTKGTVMESSHISLRDWVIAFHLMCSSKKGISAKQLQRNLGLGSYESAWFLEHRIRHSMEENPLSGLLTGKVEVDETYVGGKPRKGTGPHKPGRGTKKSPVMVLVERDGIAHTARVDRVNAKELKGAIRTHVRPDAKIITDEFLAYKGIDKEFAGGHSVVHHSSENYVNEEGEHTNTAESFFALLKRGHYGTFHSLSKQHLFRYCNEFAFRWNYRKVDDGERMVAAVQGAEGKRLMYQRSAISGN